MSRRLTATHLHRCTLTLTHTHTHVHTHTHTHAHTCTHTHVSSAQFNKSLKLIHNLNSSCYKLLIYHVCAVQCLCRYMQVCAGTLCRYVQVCCAISCFFAIMVNHTIALQATCSARHVFATPCTHAYSLV